MHTNTLADEVTRSVQGQTAFALDLYGQLKSQAGNLFCSPYSLSVTLALAGAGARGNTARQLAQVLRLPVDEPATQAAQAQLASELQQAAAGVVWRAAQALWPQTGYPLQAEYLALIKKYYGATLTALDFGEPEAARQTINQWVAEWTEGRITELIASGVLAEMTRLVLTNALYFKGKWASQFEPATTRPGKFYLAGGQTVEAPLMTQRHSFRYAANPACELVELPYVGEALAMLVLLPREKEGLAELESRLTPPQLAEWMKPLAEQSVAVVLPRFKIGSGLRLEETLQALGLTEAFDSARADFTGLGGALHELYLGAVVHQAWVEVNEEGSEAAAASATRLVLGPPPRGPVFRADHPFLFLIRDQRTGSLLFLGRVANPA